MATTEQPHLPVELTFEVREAEEGGYYARAVGYSIFTQGETREELEANIREATRCYFEPEQPAPRTLHLHYVHEEVIAL